MTSLRIAFIQAWMLSALITLSLAQFKEGIGYIGPACAVVEGNLYIHGLLMRQLNSSEIAQFESYQDALEKLKKTPSSDPSSHPVIPSFCNDMSDSTEVILKGCIVRDNRVFIKGKLIRPLNSLERETVNKLLVARSPAYTPHTLLFEKRRKREAIVEAAKKNATAEAVKDVHNDVAHFIENILKVNSTVAKRFLPVAKMSPLLNELSEDAVKAAEAAYSKKPEAAHLRETRTALPAADSVIPLNFDNTFGNQQQAFQAPAFAFAGQIEEQPFQHQLPQLTPLPSFEPHMMPETDSFVADGPSFHSYPSSQSQNIFENVPAMVNNEPLTSAFLINGNNQPIEIRGNIRPGDRIMMNGQSYIAVTMNQLNPSQLGQIGNIFGNSQPQVQQPMNTNYGSFVGVQTSQTMPQTTFWQPNTFNPYQTSQNIIPTAFGQQPFSSQPKIRYHPGKSPDASPALTQADLNAGMNVINQMPHQICTAHIVNPFWFLEK